MLPNRCKDGEGFRCHDGMCELQVVQQARRDVVSVTQRNDNIVVKQHSTRWCSGIHKGQKTSTPEHHVHPVKSVQKAIYIVFL